MNSAKRPPQTPEEMAKELTAKRASSKLYKVQADEYKASAVGAIISQTTTQLKESERRGRISLSDFDAVKRQTFEYLRACELTGVFPSMSGLARSLGYGRQAIYDLINSRTTPKTADWLERCRDLFSDILAQASLQNNCNSIVSIFLQKALYNLRESVELVVSPPSPLGEPLSSEEIKKMTQKYIEALPPAGYDDSENN